MVRSSNLRSSIAGMTMLELIIAVGILMVLASAAMPLARMQAKRAHEAELRYDLRQMRDAIDRYKDAADLGKIRTEQGTEGYPPDLDTLVNGVDMSASSIGGVGANGIPAGGSSFGNSPAGGGNSSAFGNNPAGVGSSSSTTQHVRFLRAIPVDPFTGKKDWNFQSVTDDPGTTSWGGKDVFQVHSASTGTALDGTKYADW